MKNFLGGAFGVLFGVAFLAFGIFQIFLGFVGIEYLLGKIWAYVALGVMFTLRIMLPFTIGSYFAVTEVFGYPWYLGLLAALPGIIFIIPGIIAAIFEAVGRVFR